MSSRPQVGIDRLPARRIANEPRESMNCKSCRKRKIKCNRLRPTCEACQVFACPCIYDAVPKKRGPKTDVLEALLKRVDGLEKQLHKEKTGKAEQQHVSPQNTPDSNSSNGSAAPNPQVEMPPTDVANPVHLLSPSEASQPTPIFVPDMLLDTYFSRMHGKPYYILDENTTRQRMQMNALPSFLAYAIYAVSARYASHVGAHANAVRIGLEYARRARMEVDVDEPSIENLQTLLLLTQASHQAGRGKKTYMLLSSAISMAFALDLHRELPPNLKVSQAEREGRRKLFWACYLMDRFSVCGSKRPSLIADETLSLRLPSWQTQIGSNMFREGEPFPNGSTIQYMSGPGRMSQGSSGMLIGIVRILGVTNRYLAAGGVKGDSHFPWHNLSNLSKIRQELDVWASETQDTFTSLESLFGQPDSTSLVLSKLIYHLIHCLIYRPFVPVDLAELSSTSQHQPWQIEATHLCFMHANAIAELVEIGRASAILDWPGFVAYCVCTAGTIHVHGAHYRTGEGDVFMGSPEFLSREMQQLNELRYVWAAAQHQRDTLQAIYACHSELVKSLASNPLRFAPVFQLEDFFDRYPGQAFDGSHVTFLDVVVDGSPERPNAYGMDQLPSHDPYLSQTASYSAIKSNMSLPNYRNAQQPFLDPSAVRSSQKPRKKSRRPTNPSNHPPEPTEPSTSHEFKHPFHPDNSTPLHNPQLALPADLRNGFSPPPFSPSFRFTPMPSHAIPSHESNTAPDHPVYDASFFSIGGHSITGYEQQPTPGAASASGSAHTDPEKDPFLSLLEQLAENDASMGGAGELDLFLNASAAGPSKSQGD